MESKDDLNAPAYTQPGYLYGMLIAQRKMIAAVGLMVCSAPELREELLAVLQPLREEMLAWPLPESVLVGFDEAIDFAARLST